VAPSGIQNHRLSPADESVVIEPHVVGEPKDMRTEGHGQSVIGTMPASRARPTASSGSPPSFFFLLLLLLLLLLFFRDTLMDGFTIECR
jgi:hypothetical protein